MSNRDLGLNHGAGKGDADRTDDRTAYEKNLAEIPFNPDDKEGFEQVGPGRFKKTYGAKKEEGTGDGRPAPTPSSLLLAARARRSAVTGSASEN